MTTPKDTRNERLAQKVMENLTRRHFECYYCMNASEAIEKVKHIIPEGSSVTWGGSMTIRDMGLAQALKDGKYEVIDRDLAQGQDEKRACYLQAFDCDFYLTSANALTQDGVIVNVDGNGNRVAAISYGPRKVIFVVGMNKVEPTVEMAIGRARNTAAPINTARMNLDTPCTQDGVCHNCHAEHCICNYIHLQRNSYPAGRHIVILVNEDWGF